MSYTLPPTALLKKYRSGSKFNDRSFVQERAQDLMNIFEAYKVRVRITDMRASELSAAYEITPDPGVSIKSVTGIWREIELHMASMIELTAITEKNNSIELCIKDLSRPVIGLRDIIESDAFRKSGYDFPIAVGMDMMGRPLCFGLARIPHMLIAGTTGSGKTVFIDDIIASILFTKKPDEVKLLMIDPKKCELNWYNKIPHLLAPVISDTETAITAFRLIEEEISRRFRTLAAANVRKLDDYNEISEEKLPRIVVIIDEYMEMMFAARNAVENSVAVITRNGRAVGVHLIIATQRPSADVITPAIISNMPCRASFTMVDKRDSRTILERTGAERLLGSGDMLFTPSTNEWPIHAQAAYISDEEVLELVRYVGAQN